MRMTLLAGLGSIMMVALTTFSAAAHQGSMAHSTPQRSVVAVGQEQAPTWGSFAGVALHGPTNNPLSTATGGPTGGLADRSGGRSQDRDRPAQKTCAGRE